MIDPNLLDDLSRRMADAFPLNVSVLSDDLRRNLRASLESALGRMDLVTREEFDIQAAVLARTRAKLERLEARLAALEAAPQATGDREANGAP
jgi:ubiquinone biosynthesis accessory factor UbiK